MNFVPCKPETEYDVCGQCREELRALAYVIEGQTEMERPNPAPDDHYDAAEGAGRLCGGHQCLHPPSRRYLVIRQNPEYGDQEMNEGNYDELCGWMAAIILGDPNHPSPARGVYERWLREMSLPARTWNAVRWYDEAGKGIKGSFTLYLLAGSVEVIGEMPED